VSFGTLLPRWLISMSSKKLNDSAIRTLSAKSSLGGFWTTVKDWKLIHIRSLSATPSSATQYMWQVANDSEPPMSSALLDDLCRL
jgi:hypothetical protein